jgi:hypothetical protein
MRSGRMREKDEGERRDMSVSITISRVLMLGVYFALAERVA